MTSRPRILLVDDVDANLIALEAQLTDLECEMDRASHGNDALRMLLKREYALVLLDVQMPGMDGYEVARYARENPQTRDVPIIFVTAMHETESSVLRGYGAGAVDLLFKPIDPYVLRSKVEVFLDLHRSRQTLAAETAAHRRTAAELAAANVELIQASRTKSEFLSMMSHELRTPLNAIVGFSELLVDGRCGPLNEQQMRFLRNVHDSSLHLLTLINDLLDLAKIEAGRLDISTAACATGDLVFAALASLQQLATAKQITLAVDHEGSPPPLLADPVRLKQLLYNLLSNGIKFTPSGGRVSVSFTRTDDGLVRTVVRDTGPGLTPDELAKLFQPFTQLDNARHTRGGTGLGLSLCRHLAELMGGRAGAESTPGEGSAFYFDLPPPP